MYGGDRTVSVAFSRSTIHASTMKAEAGNNMGSTTVYFGASYANSIYGASTTVQSPAISSYSLIKL